MKGLAAVAFVLGLLMAGASQSQPAAAPQVQDMWWAGPQESGWGVSIIQHGERLFAVLYVYDDTGHTSWFVMPSGTWNEARTAYSGALYFPQGSHFPAYQAALFSPGAPVGEATLEFASPGQAHLSYLLRGVRASHALVRQPFGPLEAAPRAGLTDMWWGGPAQDGWGVAIVQHHATLFSVFFSYDRQGNPAWWVFPGGSWTTANTYEGRVYRPANCRWFDVPFDCSRMIAPDQGGFRFTFVDGENAVLEFTASGVGVRLSLVRQGF